MRARRIIVWVAAVLLRLLARTWRFDFDGPDPLARPGPTVGALWHRDLLIAALAYRDLGFGVPVSRSRDGDWIAAILVRLGYVAPPRGSSSRGGADALRGMVRLVRAGTTVAVPVDGPKGPAGVPKPGVVTLSQLTGVPITAVTFEPKRAFRFGSWDRMKLPYPFTTIRARYSPPLSTDRSADAKGVAQDELRETLDALSPNPFSKEC